MPFASYQPTPYGGGQPGGYPGSGGGGYNPQAYNPNWSMYGPMTSHLNPHLGEMADRRGEIGGPGRTGLPRDAIAAELGYDQRPTFTADRGMGWGAIPGLLGASMGGPIGMGMMGGLNMLGQQGPAGSLAANYVGSGGNLEGMAVNGLMGFLQHPVQNTRSLIDWFQGGDGPGGAGPDWGSLLRKRPQQPVAPEEQARLAALAKRNGQLMGNADWNELIRDVTYKGSGGWGLGDHTAGMNSAYGRMGPNEWIASGGAFSY